MDGLVINLNVREQLKKSRLAFQIGPELFDFFAQLGRALGQLSSILIGDLDASGRNPAHLIRLIIRRTVGLD